MNYEDSLEAIVSKEEAKKEITKHGGSFEEFLSEVGDKPSYRGSQVLEWLGY